MNKSFKKTVITVTVLSEGDFDFDNLGDVHYAITDGDCSGAYEVTECTYLSRDQMSEALKAQGSDPSFLLGDEDDENEESDGQN